MGASEMRAKDQRRRREGQFWDVHQMFWWSRARGGDPPCTRPTGACPGALPFVALLSRSPLLPRNELQSQAQKRQQEPTLAARKRKRPSACQAKQWVCRISSLNSPTTQHGKGASQTNKGRRAKMGCHGIGRKPWMFYLFIIYFVCLFIFTLKMGLYNLRVLIRKTCSLDAYLP